MSLHDLDWLFHKTSVYPWRNLVEPGDYFVVGKTFRTRHQLQVILSNRNKQYAGLLSYDLMSLSEEHWVILIDRVGCGDTVFLRKKGEVGV